MGALDAATQVEAGTDNDSAGYRLRSARERLNLSIRDVASTLNLMVSHVRGIETDRFAELTNDKKFLHHVHDYATLLDLDANEIVDMYRSQSAASAAQIQTHPAKHLRRYDSKWYAVGALAVACVCLGIWSLNQTLPAKSTGSSAKSGSETEQQNPSTATAPIGNDRIEIAANMDASESASKLPSGAKNIAGVAPSTVKREEIPPGDEPSTSTALETVARSDHAALETTRKQRDKNASSSAPIKVKGKNALRAVGAKPLRKTLVELKGQGSAQAQDKG